MTRSDFVLEGAEVVRLEAEALLGLERRLDQSFDQACRRVLACQGRVVVVGMGKSGHIAGKIAATLASTGTPAFFVHPGEASHGDLGMITPSDLVIAISNSGETPEILTILPIIKRMGVGLIALTGNVQSTLARTADIVLDIGVEKEACPLNMAPTASTATTLAMGDALAIAVLKSRDFTLTDFARSHPGGTIGRRLLLYVKDVMHTGERIPVVTKDASVDEALLEMSSKGLGMTAIVDTDNGPLCGIFTDGDLRRSLGRSVDIYHCPIVDVMTREPKTASPDALAAEVVQMMRQYSINGLFAVDENRNVVGALNTLDLIRAGVV
jgi:arabinose-5-phosphate isomerase